MKKLWIITLAFCMTLFIQQARAQTGVKNRLGFFGALASGEIDEVGFGGIGEFRVAPRVTISPQVTFFLPEDHGNHTASFLELNGNVNYYFYNKDIFEFYGLGGLNYTRRHLDFDDGGDQYDGELGLNVGGGINFDVGPVVPFSELRATIGDFNQVVVTAGLKFNLR
jgi:outer membrane immunogenic protein